MKKIFVILFLSTLVYCKGQTKAGELLWEYATSDKLVTTPSVFNDRIYYGSIDGNFYCNNLQDGKLLWKYATGKPIRSSASIGDGNVFFGCDDGNIYALDTL